MLDPLRMSAALGIALVLAACLQDGELHFYKEEPVPQANAEQVAALVAQLGSPRFDERDGATRLLEPLGPTALEPLREVLQSSDPEARRRARQLVQKIERRVEATRILEPTRLRLVYRDTPLNEAMADFAQKAGCALQLEGNRTKLAERRITLDTRDTTFWEALDRFCRQAGLAERISPNAGLEHRGSYDAREPRIVALGEVYGEGTSRSESALVLKDGTPQPLPTYQAGAFRIRALPLAGQTRADGETLFGLEVRLEPRLPLQSVLALRIDRAVDAQGQILTLPGTAVFGAGSSAGGSAPEVFLIWDGASELPTNLPGSAGHVPVRLRFAERPPGRLRELRGTVALQVQLAPEPLVTVDRILEAGGQTVKGGDSSMLKLIEVRREEDGQVKLRVEVTPPPRDLFLGGAPARILLVNEGWWRGRGIPVPLPVAAEQLALFDARGQLVPRVSGSIPAVNGKGTGWELSLVYRPAQGQEEPARLVYTGRRTPSIEVAFTLKDVPLP